MKNTQTVYNPSIYQNIKIRFAYIFKRGSNPVNLNETATAMSPQRAKSVRFDPTNPQHLDAFAISFEGYTISLEYVKSLDALRTVITEPDGEERTRPVFWNVWCPSAAIDQTFQRELLPLIGYRRAQQKAQVLSGLAA